MKNILFSKHKKAQLSIGDAPGVVLIVLFLFMIMGTSAYMLDKYGEAFGAEDAVTILNETVTQVELAAGEILDGAIYCNAQDFAVTNVYNQTTGTTFVINSGNYTVNSATGTFANTTGTYPSAAWSVSYTYNYGGVACNITEALTQEVEDNTSIAGMVLTIALIGIVLSILIGLFYVFTRGGRGM